MHCLEALSPVLFFHQAFQYFLHLEAQIQYKYNNHMKSALGAHARYSGTQEAEAGGLQV